MALLRLLLLLVFPLDVVVPAHEADELHRVRYWRSGAGRLRELGLAR